MVVVCHVCGKSQSENLTMHLTKHVYSSPKPRILYRIRCQKTTKSFLGEEKIVPLPCEPS